MFDQIINLIDIIIWPVVVIILCGFVFKENLKTLLDRLLKVGKGGAEFAKPQSQTVDESESKRAADEFLRSSGETPTVKHYEDLIVEDLQSRGINELPDQKEVLIKSLATNQLLNYFEIIYSSIWGSQIRILHELNSSQEGVETSYIENSYYKPNKKFWPESFGNYLFEQYIDFLASYNLVTTIGTKLFITAMGQDFIQWLVTARKSPRVF